jgi:hypothetical protein
VNSIFDKRVNASLVDATHRPRGARLGDKWVLKCSGRGGDPLNDQQAPDIKALAARGFSVMHGTWVATNHWGKDAAQTEAIAGKTYVQNPANFAAASGPVPIIGSSMGGLIALLLLVNNPTLFSCVAVGIPAVSPIDIHDNNLGGYASDIESAYTNLAGWNAAKATHDPLTRAAEFVALKDRIKIWYSNNDRPGGPLAAGSGCPRTRSSEKDTLDHFERFCYTLKLKDGAGRFKLDDWILDALADYFDGLFETLLLLPTGNGKSTLLGALALHHATYVRADPRVIVLGGQGKHARNTLDAASWFIGQSTDLSRWWEPQEYGQGRIKSLIDPASKGAGIHVFSTGGNGRKKGGGSVEGDEWTLLLVEELHRHEDNGGAVRTLTSKAQKRDTPETPTRIVHATTAGDNMQSPLGRLIDRVTDVARAASSRPTVGPASTTATPATPTATRACTSGRCRKRSTASRSTTPTWPR